MGVIRARLRICGEILEGKETHPLKRPSIKLLNVDRSHNRYLTLHERNQLLNGKPPQIKRVSTKRAKTETYMLIPQPIAIRDMHEASPPSITNREMKVNAGVEAGNRKRVRAKVNAHKTFRWNVTVKQEIIENGLVFSPEE